MPRARASPRNCATVLPSRADLEVVSADASRELPSQPAPSPRRLPEPWTWVPSPAALDAGAFAGALDAGAFVDAALDAGAFAAAVGAFRAGAFAAAVADDAFAAGFPAGAFAAAFAVGA